MATIAEFIGALVATGVFFAVFVWLLSKIGIASTLGVIAANTLSLTGCGIAYAYGVAEGREPDFVSAFFDFLPPQLFWFVIGLVRLRRNSNIANP